MPLRVAEKDGYLYAINGCGDCPFEQLERSFKPTTKLAPYCGHENGKTDNPVINSVIPVWCPLPEPSVSKKDIKGVIDTLREGNRRKDEIISSFMNEIPKTMTEFMVTKENEMRGKHPENIVFEQPEIFIVESFEIRSDGTHVKIVQKGLCGESSWTSIRKDDILGSVNGNYRVAHTPTSSTIIVYGPLLEEGQTLTLLGPE